MLKIVQAKSEEHLRDITQEEELTTENTEHTEKRFGDFSVLCGKLLFFIW